MLHASFSLVFNLGENNSKFEKNYIFFSQNCNTYITNNSHIRNDPNIYKIEYLTFTNRVFISPFLVSLACSIGWPFKIVAFIALVSDLFFKGIYVSYDLSVRDIVWAATAFS